MIIQHMIPHIRDLQRKFETQFGAGPVANVDAKDKDLVDAISKGKPLSGTALVKALDRATDAFRAADSGLFNPTANDGVLQPHELDAAHRKLGFATQLAARVEQRAKAVRQISAEVLEARRMEFDAFRGVTMESQLSGFEQQTLANVLSLAPKDRTIIPRKMIDTAVGMTSSMEVKLMLCEIDLSMRAVDAKRAECEARMTNEQNLARRAQLVRQLGSDMLDDERLAPQVAPAVPLTHPGLRALATAELAALRKTANGFSASDKAKTLADCRDAIAVGTAQIESVLRMAKSTLIERPTHVMSDAKRAEITSGLQAIRNEIERGINAA